MKNLILLSLLLIGYNCPVYATEAPEVHLANDAGLIRGKIHEPEGEDFQVYAYQGIRYGRAERFAKPVPVTRWPENPNEEFYDATKDGNSCYQFLISDLDIESFFPTTKSEDCLFLNVLKPMNDNGGKLRPVMVWIYGGGFQSGTIFSPIYDGSRLAAHGDVIVVSLNYRLGVLGFSYLGIDGAQGNQGFYDQILGLKWVQQHIQSFGGDPNQVTVFGESAGSISVTTLMLSPMAKGLFHRAILQSGAVIPTKKFFRELEFGEMMTKKFAEKIGCNKQDDLNELLDCMKNVPIETIQKEGKVFTGDMIQGEMVGPLIDNQILPYDVMGLERGFNPVDILFGATRNEGSMFVKSMIPIIADDYHKFTMDEVKETMTKLMNAHFIYDVDDILEHYTKNLDVNDGDQVRDAIGQMYGDFRLGCPTILFAEELAKRSTPGQYHFYGYRFDHLNPSLGKLMNCRGWMGVCHGMDVIFVFGNALLKMYPEDERMNNEIINAWTSFAKTGHPGSMGGVEWQEIYEDAKNPNSKSRIMMLESQFRMVEDLYKDTCNKIWAPKMAPWHPNYVHDNKPPKTEL